MKDAMDPILLGYKTKEDLGVAQELAVQLECEAIKAEEEMERRRLDRLGAEDRAIYLKGYVAAVVQWRFARVAAEDAHRNLHETARSVTAREAYLEGKGARG